MKTVIHRARSRGGFDHGWLETYHTFSFANYFDPERIHFGALRVLNDDTVQGGTGFGTHPHDNMEIISIPLEGTLEHRDSMGNVSVIGTGEIQVMSAGTGITHSEHNRSETGLTRFLQIWVFPRERGITPRYSQMRLKDTPHNQLQLIVSPDGQHDSAWIHQDAWFYLSQIDEGKTVDYRMNKEGDGVYVFVLEGEVAVGNEKLGRRDGMGIYDTDSFSLTATRDARVLLMEVPLMV